MFKKQFCNFNENFSIQTLDEVHILLYQPILLDSDILWLVGAEPSQKHIVGNQLVMKYVVQKENNTSNNISNCSIPIHLYFHKIDGRFKLNQCVIAKNLTRFLTPEMIIRSAKQVCNEKWEISGRTIKVDISDIDKTSLPTKADLFNLFGIPSIIKNNGSVICYKFQLDGCESKWKKVIIETLYDNSGTKLIGVKVKYLRYKFDADFVAGKMLVGVRFMESKYLNE